MVSREWEHKPQTGISDKGLLSEIYNENLKLNNKKMKNSIKKKTDKRSEQILDQKVYKDCK